MVDIDIRIPWDGSRRLGAAYNKMFATVDGWVLILDWDCVLLSLDWFKICQRAIEAYGDTAGLFTCVTNRIGCRLQKAIGCPDTDVLDDHRAYAVKRATEYKGQVVDTTSDSAFKLSGLFFLTHRRVWDRIGRVPEDKFLGLDNWYQDRCKEAGLRTYILSDLYCYHGYRRVWKHE